MLKRQTDKTLDVGNDNKSENFCVNIDFCTVRPALALCGHNLTTPHWDRILPEVTLTFLLVCDFIIKEFGTNCVPNGGIGKKFVPKSKMCP